ncbi:MAG: SMP-30/gluconolactonase/LRE family protein [Polyangiales bacterium]
MKTTRLALALLLSIAACGDDDTPDAGQTPDSAVADASSDVGAGDTGNESDAGADAGASDAGSDANIPDVFDAGPPACGTEQPSVAAVRGTEGVAIAPDGTIYYSQSGGIGRILPGMDAENDWITGLGGTMWGLAYRASDDVLFAATPAAGGGTIYRVDTTAEEATAESFITGAGAPNGLILAGDDGLLFSDFSGGTVMYVEGDGEPTLVGRFTQPNGLFLDDDGTLLVLSYGPGEIFRLTVNDDWSEMSREMVADIDAAPDGIGRDEMGRYYVTDNGDGRLFRFNADFGAEEQLLTGVPSAANIAWGQGPLVCTELYVTSGATMRVVDVGATGRP